MKTIHRIFFLAVALVIALTSLAAVAQAPAPAAHPNRRINVSWSVAQAMLISKVPPRYPEEAKQKHIAGMVALEVLVSPEGNVESTKPLNGPEELRQAAIDCVQQWKFRPYLLNGEPIQVRTEIPVYFMRTK